MCVVLLSALPGLHVKADLSTGGLALSAPRPRPEYTGDGIGMAGENKSASVRGEKVDIVIYVSKVVVSRCRRTSQSLIARCFGLVVLCG